MHAMNDFFFDRSTPYLNNGDSFFLIKVGLVASVDVELSVRKNSSTDNGRNPHRWDGIGTRSMLNTFK